MHRLLIIFLVSLGLILVACGGGDSLGGFPVGDLTDEEAIRQMDEEGTRLSEEGDYKAIYQFFEPAYREACASDRFVRMGRLGDALDSIMRSHERDGEIVSIEVEGDRAVVTSLDYSPARDELDEETDDAVKIEGRWFIAADVEGIEACNSDMFAEDASTDAAVSVFRFGLLLPAADGDGASAIEALFEKTFSEGFKRACPYSAFGQTLPNASDRFRSTFEDPFGWNFQVAPKYVWINSGLEPVATLVFEADIWKLDSLAGLEECA